MFKAIPQPTITMTRAQLEQALQDSEIQEVLHNAARSFDRGHTALRRAIIDRLFLWQSVNRSISA